MKYVVCLMFTVLIGLSGCTSNNVEDVLEEPPLPNIETISRSSSSIKNEEYQFIDFIDDESFNSQFAVIEIAKERLDKYVSFNGERYIMTSCTPQEVGLSKRVIEYMQTLMERQNEKIHEFKDWTLVDNKVFVYTELGYTSPKIVSRSETSQSGGVTKCEVRQEWNGTHVSIYLSQSALTMAGASTGVLELASALIPNPFVRTAIIAACELVDKTCDMLAAYYPNGVIISILLPSNGAGCVPYSLKGQ